jgi:PAS domain S-box-containing protein
VSSPPDPAIDYASLVEVWAELHTVTTLDGVYRYVSPACQRLFGWDASSFEGRSENDFVHPDDVSVLRASRADLEFGRVATATYRFKCGDASYR